MSILLLLVAGFLSDFAEGDSCIDALHQLRTEQRMQIVATDVLEDNADDDAGDDVDEDLGGTDGTIIEPLEPAGDLSDENMEEPTDLQ